MRIRPAFIALFVVFSVMSTSLLAQRTHAPLPPVRFTEYRLKNGLRVILHEDHSVPIAAVNVWYHVGSKNEVPGRTGFAHLFEHMMFQGSKNYDNDYFKALDEAGANINGSTNADRTNYYEVVPSNYLETALFLEADRMGGLLEAMTQEKLDNQRDVVKNERRQRYDNAPYGTSFEKISALIYPANHPYRWTTIGSLDDLTAASQEDVKAFFREYYVPNNASLVIAGDFKPAQARAWVQKYFGPIKSGKPIRRPNPPQPMIDGVIRREYEDSVQLPRLYQVWHTVPQGNRDEYALDILSAILSNGRGARLQSKLVYDGQIAQDVNASHPTREIGGQFVIQTTARPDKTLGEIEQQINIEIERIKREPPTAQEVARAVNQIESQTVFGLQTVLAKADQMNNNATFYGRPDMFNERLAAYRRVTPADVTRVANTYLIANHLVMSFVPRKGKVTAVAPTAANIAASRSAKTKPAPDVGKHLPKPGPVPSFALPSIEKETLSNGLEVWLVRRTELPIVSMNMVFKTGGTIDPPGKTGLSSFTAEQLNKGTRTRTAIDIANQLQHIGANLNTGSGWDMSNVSMQTLTKNLDPALAIFSDVIVNPVFPAKELETARNRALVALRQRRDNPNAVASVVYSSILYGKNHPYGNVLTGDEASIKSFKQSELEKFYQANYRPNNAVLIVVGDTTMPMLRPKLESAFAGWQRGDVEAWKPPVAAEFNRPGIYVVDKPGAAQSVVVMGQVGVARDNPDYFPLLVMNDILGGAFSSRLNMNLREDKGYTYGAGSGFAFRRGAGPFSANAQVQTAYTKESVLEFLKEIRGIRGAVPITQQELETAKKSLILGFPSGFETNGQVANQFASIVTFGLPDSYFNDYIRNVSAVTMADVNRVANRYLTPDRMAILIVGDRTTIEPGLQQIEIWGNKISYLDADGNPIK